jgi:hypothetical protein
MFVGDVIGVSESGALGALIVGINLPLAGLNRGTRWSANCLLNSRAVSGLRGVCYLRQLLLLTVAYFTQELLTFAFSRALRKGDNVDGRCIPRVRAERSFKFQVGT